MQIFNPDNAPLHGGRLNAAAQQSDIKLANWLDLSTGINLNGWPVPSIPEHIFTRLPEDDDGLAGAANEYYGANNHIVVAGSQAAIQLLPQMRPSCHVGIISPGYQEHAYCWHAAGHTLSFVTSEEIDTLIDELDVLVLINPNNPTGEVFTREQLLDWHGRLANRDGWLIVDEAFMDAQLGHSLVKDTQRKGLIVLRSLGKFFGLAGLRVGFVFAEKSLLNVLKHKLGPWSVSHPSRYIARLALSDFNWQQKTRQSIARQSDKLVTLMSVHNLAPHGGTHLFQWVKSGQALRWYEQLAQQGILVRYFDQISSLRFGLPKNDFEFERLELGLTRAQKVLEENGFV